jgi:hypothetical protein
MYATPIKNGFPVINGEQLGMHSLASFLVTKDNLEGFRIRAGNINDITTAVAYKMRMGAYNPVEPFLPVHHPQGYDETMLPKQVDITIYRGKGKVGNSGFKFFIHPLGAGMGCGSLNKFQNRIPLLAVFFPNPVHQYINLHYILELIMITIISILILKKIGKYPTNYFLLHIFLRGYISYSHSLGMPGLTSTWHIVLCMLYASKHGR